MTTVGFDRSLYVLPFDRRVFFQRKLSPDQTAQIAAAKQVIYDGFRAAVAAGVPKEKAGILVDEQFGRAVLRDAAAEGYTLACPAEKSGQGEFDFEYGEDFAEHIEAFHPTFCKVLVRYNPEGDQARNRRQAERLKRLSYYLREKSKSLFMFELLVPAEKFQLDGLQGLDRREDCRKIVAAARRGGRTKVSCIVHGQGEGENKVSKWLTTAASVSGFIGFTVDETDFREPLLGWWHEKTTREDAVAEIAARYRRFVEIFERARAA